MGAEIVGDLKTGLLHLGLHDVGHQRDAASAPGSSLRALLDSCHVLGVSGLDAGRDVSLGHVVTRADLGVVVQVGPVILAALLADDEVGRGDVESLLLLGDGDWRAGSGQ